MSELFELFNDEIKMVDIYLICQESDGINRTLTASFNKHKESIKLESIINRLVKRSTMLNLFLPYYRNQLRLNNFTLSSTVSDEVLKDYPDMFKVIDGQAVLMANLERFKEDTTPLVSGTTGREEYKLLDVLAGYY